MSYNQKPPGSSGSGIGGGPPNGPNNMPQVAKTFAGIQQQMQNLVHGQNAIPQSSQADINAFLQQQRIQNMLKQQQQFLQFQHQMQQQQQQQQQHQHHNMPGAGVVGSGVVGGVPGVGAVAGAAGGGASGSGEPLALTRTAGAAELLNKTYQQQANGNPAANPTFNQLQQTLQSLPTNFVQHLQVFQYQMQAKQMQQQQHGGGQGQHGHGQQQPVQGIPPPTSATPAMPHQQQQQQKHQNQHQQQQQQNALSRYLTAAAAQAVAVSGNKLSSATPPPPPLTNQMKPPNLPPNTQITPVTAANISGGNISASPHSKISTGNTNTASAKHPAPPPSISLTPSKPATSSPSAAHQQNKFTPPTNSGAKGGHLGHSQNLPKSTHGASHTATSNTASSAKAASNADATVASLKSPQSTPVQLTKQMPPTTTTATIANKPLTNSTATTTGSTSTIVSPLKSATTSITSPTASSPIASNPSTTVASNVLSLNTSCTVSANANSSKPSAGDAAKPATDEPPATKLPTKPANAEKETEKASSNDTIKPTSDSSGASNLENTNKETQKLKESKLEPEKPKEKKLEPDAQAKKSSIKAVDSKSSLEKTSSELKLNAVSNISSNKSSAIESKEREEKIEIPIKSNKPDNHDVTENEKHQLDNNKCTEKNKPTTTDEKNCKPAISPIQNTAKDPVATISDVKNVESDLNEIGNSHEDKKIESKEKLPEKEKKLPEKEKEKPIKSNKSTAKVEQTENFALKDAEKAEAVVDKPITAVETKTTPPIIAQSNPDKIIRKDETNNKASLETCNKNDSSESEQNKKEEKQSVAAANEAEVTKTSKVEIITEHIKDTVPKESETPLIPLKTSEKIAIIEKPTKTFLPQSAANKKNVEDNTNDSAMSAQKEMITAVTTPVKKVARLTKVIKSKPLTPSATEMQEENPTASSVRAKRKPKADNSLVLDSASSTSKDDDSDRKSKRHRLKTILYQSPLPELAYITKLSASEASNSPKPMSNEDRLIVFYKNEYMAVRNAEGTFYLCQTMQNVYRTSPRISIRWLSEDAKDNNVFIPDFYDHTDIECVLTTVELKRIDKGHLRLPKGERNRIESILKKAIDVEKGLVPRPELTAENPDGLDISLFKDESQIEKKSALTDGSESLTPSIGSGRKPRRGVTTAAKSARKAIGDASTPLASSRYKRKRDNPTPAKSSSLAKKRKTLVKRKRKIDHSDDDDDDETSDDYASDTEYKPTQKRSSLNISCISKSTPRAQRSPLAKARAASPITPTTSRSKNVPQNTTPTPSTSKALRGERAAKRKAIVDSGSSEEALTPVKKPTTISNNKSKGTLKKTKH